MAVFFDDRTVECNPDNVYRAMELYAGEVAVDYAYWLFERAFSKLMERPYREGRKLFLAYKQQQQQDPFAGLVSAQYDPNEINLKYIAAEYNPVTTQWNAVLETREQFELFSKFLLEFQRMSGKTNTPDL